MKMYLISIYAQINYNYLENEKLKMWFLYLIKGRRSYNKISLCFKFNGLKKKINFKTRVSNLRFE